MEASGAVGPWLVPAAAGTPTVAGETAGTASRWTFGTMVLWGVVVCLLLYLVYRRFG